MISAKEGRKYDTAPVVRSKIFVPERDRHNSLEAHGEFVCPQDLKLTAVPFVHEVLAICNRVYSLKLGKVFFTGTPDTLKHDKAKIKESFL